MSSQLSPPKHTSSIRDPVQASHNSKGPCLQYVPSSVAAAQSRKLLTATEVDPKITSRRTNRTSQTSQMSQTRQAGCTRHRLCRCCSTHYRPSWSSSTSHPYLRQHGMLYPFNLETHTGWSNGRRWCWPHSGHSNGCSSGYPVDQRGQSF